MSYRFIDFEFDRRGGFHGLALLGDGEAWCPPDRSSLAAAHKALLERLQPDDVLVGHNLIQFDLPQLAERLPRSPLLDLPVVDTLELSVLGFPARPYHRLAKDDKLVRHSKPDPVADVRASQIIFREALLAFGRLPPAEQRVLAGLLSTARLSPTRRAGWNALFAELGWTADPIDEAQLLAAWRGRVCCNARGLDPERDDLALAMVSAWLRTSHHGEVCVLPAWVRRSLPSTRSIARALRTTPCRQPDCDWCATQNSPEHWLGEVFGFPGYREQPATPDGRSLQRVLVERGLAGESTFGILPTGGGKSLCFQVPAEARYRLLGQLTVVISPLRSLMKDQVDNLRDRIPHATAIYGGLPGMLRPEILRRVREGETGLLYLSPEQFRNQTILRLLAGRELGAIVFDEAHCLSQWGHDFRTDYPYVLKAVRRLTEAQGAPMPPVFLFTATTQADATQEICDHVAETSGHHPELIDGGSERENLTYIVCEVAEAKRLEVTLELLEEHLGSGSAILFCGSRRRTEDYAQLLSDHGHPTRAYHAGLDADERRALQTAFIAGEHRILTATNAFGMGVDKEDVRLVVHLDMPSSLEAYLQEAGRAGRDRLPAHAVLLWAPGDAEARFRLTGTARLSREDLAALWRAIKALPSEKVPSGSGESQRHVVTARELLFREEVQGSFDPLDANEETRVKAAVNWLERAQLLERTENVTHVFSGTPKDPSLSDSIARLDRLNLPEHSRRQYRTVLERVWGAGDDGLAADDIAVLIGELGTHGRLEGGKRALAILQELVKAGLLTAGQTFTAFIAHGMQESSRTQRDRWVEREERIVEVIEEADDPDTPRVDLLPLAQKLTVSGQTCSVQELRKLLRTWNALGQGFTREPVAPTFKGRRNHGRLELNGSTTELKHYLRLRAEVGQVLLGALEGLASERGRVLVSGTLENLVHAVESDLALRSAIDTPLEATRAAMTWLHDLGIVHVQNGLAVFRSAMRLDRPRAAPAFGKGASAPVFKQLATHQQQANLRIHVMDTWCRQMLRDVDQADQLRRDWFGQRIECFKKRWFTGQTGEIDRPTTPESFARIVTDLEDGDQQQIVTAAPSKNLLVLAGPGSGKTRVLVHRVAWLLRVERVRPRQILIVCYTRANAFELRRRLHDLVGDDARGVTIRTLHGVALTMVGFERRRKGGWDAETLHSLIPRATRLLCGADLDESGASRQREGLLRGYRYLFVDEYQDVDAEKNALLEALIGRNRRHGGRRLRVFAVGDDDQAIFAHDGSKTEFLRAFESTYDATAYIVRTNYRNPAAVMELAQGVLSSLTDRMKQGTTLTVDPKRRTDPPAGPWAEAHLRGRMVWHRVQTVQQAAFLLMETIHAWRDEVPLEQIGVLSRTRRGLRQLRVAAEKLKMPFRWPLASDQHVPLSRVREIVGLFTFLRGQDGPLKGTTLQAHLTGLGPGLWGEALRRWLEPNIGATWHPDRWQADLVSWLHLERSARSLGSGVTLSTMHSAKGLEFDHVLLLDEGNQSDTEDERRLLYVALTRTRQSLQIFGPKTHSRVLGSLSHPLLESCEPPIPRTLPDHEYGLLGRGDLWIDWLGRQSADHPGHRALRDATASTPFELREVADGLGILAEVAGVWREVGRIKTGASHTWRIRNGHKLRLKLLAVLVERADDPAREEPYRDRLKVDTWYTGVWETRWRTPSRAR